MQKHDHPARTSSDPQSSRPVVSIIIPAYNEAHMIEDVVRRAQDAAKVLACDVEVIVVNDASTDDTAALAKSAGARVINVENRQISKTRNDGARAAHGAYLVFLDGDTLLPEQTFVAAMRALDHGAAGGGALVMFDDDVPWYWQALLPVLRATMRLLRASPGCFIFCTRRAFDAVGGFDETVFAGEEVWFSWGLNRHGRFVVLREPVLTSGRKSRLYSPREIFGTLLRMVTNPWASKRRDGLDVWYDGRRER